MKVVYYLSKSGNNPVKDFIDQLSNSTKAKVLRKLLCLQQYGITSISAHVKKLSGSNLWEIRVLGKASVRVIYAHIQKDTVLLLHAFSKKSQKTSRNDLLIALLRLKEWNQTNFLDK